MNALVILAKFVVLVALVSVVPFWLAVYGGVPVLWSVGGSIAAAVVLMAIWTQGRRAS